MKLHPAELAQRIAPDYQWREEVFTSPSQFIGPKRRSRIEEQKRIEKELRERSGKVPSTKPQVPKEAA